LGLTLKADLLDSSAMLDAMLVEWIRNKYANLAFELDERGRRRWAAVEAQSLGRGGIVAVATATGISDRTIRTGIKELKDPQALASDQQRRGGGGRKRRQDEQPELMEALDALINPTTRGDPMNPLRWTCKSTRTLAAELRKQGYQVGASTVRCLLVNLGYSLQANRKKREGKQHPDRDAQFQHINARVLAQKRRGEPALSVGSCAFYRRQLALGIVIVFLASRQVSDWRPTEQFTRLDHRYWSFGTANVDCDEIATGMRAASTSLRRAQSLVRVRSSVDECAADRGTQWLTS
jgi:transposase